MKFACSGLSGVLLNDVYNLVFGTNYRKKYLTDGIQFEPLPWEPSTYPGVPGQSVQEDS
jgi:hypothetical protein